MEQSSLVDQLDGIKMKTKCEVYSRTVGYIRPVSQWHVGKQEEFHKRRPTQVDSLNL